MHAFSAARMDLSPAASPFAAATALAAGQHWAGIKRQNRALAVVNNITCRMSSSPSKMKKIKGCRSFECPGPLAKPMPIP